MACQVGTYSWVPKWRTISVITATLMIKDAK
jgi:hypothetical protein